MSRGRHTAVIGLGNPIMGDDGLGLVALARLRRDWRVPPTVRLVDGGTWGLSLLPVIEEAGAVLVVDAIDAARAPGDLILLGPEELPRHLGHKLSSHQVALGEVLAIAELRGSTPGRLVAIGIQPGRVEISAELSPPVAAALDALVGAIVAQLEVWGHVLASAPGADRSEPGRDGSNRLDLISP